MPRTPCNKVETLGSVVTYVRLHARHQLDVESDGRGQLEERMTSYRNQRGGARANGRMQQQQQQQQFRTILRIMRQASDYPAIQNVVLVHFHSDNNASATPPRIDQDVHDY